jgi:hypothetical protein
MKDERREEAGNGGYRLVVFGFWFLPSAFSDILYTKYYILSSQVVHLVERSRSDG